MVIGSNVELFETTKIVNGDNLTIGDYSQIGDFVFLNAGLETVLNGNNYIGPNSSIIGGGRLILGSFAAMSAGCCIVTGTDDFSGNHLMGHIIPHQLKEVQVSTTIFERHVALGVNVTVLPGVTIGEGAIVAAGSVVRKDLEPWTIYAGHNPRKTGERNKEKVISLELEYYESYLEPELSAKHGDRIAELRQILRPLSAQTL